MKRNDENKLLLLKSILKITFIMTIISVILKLLGLDIFQVDIENRILISICNFLDKNNLNDIVIVIFMLVDTFIVFRLCCENKNIKTYYIATIIYSVINLTAQALVFTKISFDYYPFLTVPLTIIITMIIDKKIKIKRQILVITMLSIYQLGTMFLRNVTYNEKFDIMYFFLLNFDYIILMMISYYIFLKKDFGIKLNNFSLLKYFNQFNLSDLKLVKTEWKEKLKIFSSKKRQAKAMVIIYLILVILSEGFNLALIIFIAILNHTLIELLFMVSSFLISKKVFGTSFHFDSAVKCWIVSNSTYYILDRITFPIGISLVVPITLGIGLAYIVCIILKKNNKNLYRGMLENDLLEICKDKQLTKYEIELLKDFYCFNLSIPKMAEKHHYSEVTIKRQKRKALQKIEKS